MKRAAALGSVLLAMLWGGAARADEVIRDGADFAVDLSALGACVVIPAELQSDAACAGLPVEAMTKAPRPSRVVGVAYARHAGGIASISIERLPNTDADRRGEAESPEKFAANYAVAQQMRVPPGATVIAKDARKADVGGTHVLRAVVTVEGLRDDDPARALERQAVAVTHTAKSAYTVLVSGDRDSAAEIDRIADAIVGTIRVSPAAVATAGGDAPARAEKAQEEEAYPVSRVVGPVALIGVLLVAGSYFSKRKPRKGN